MNIVCVCSICSIMYKIDFGCFITYIQINDMSAAMNCNYCKTSGHVKTNCPLLEKKKMYKKSERARKGQERRFTTLIKKWGNTPEGMQRLWDDSSEKIELFREKERLALGDGKIDEALADELANLEEEYESAVAFQAFVKNADISFTPEMKKKTHGTQNFYADVSALETNLCKQVVDLEEMLDSSEDSLVRAGDFYWRMMYGRGRTVFYGWLDTIRASRDSMKSILAGGKWKSETPVDVLDIRATLESSSKPKKLACGKSSNKKLSQKQRRALAVSK